MKEAKIALVHHYLVFLRGGEKVLKAFCEIYPDAALYTLFADAATIRSFGLKPHTSRLQRLFNITRRHKLLLPLFPLAAESLDLQNFDIVITSDASFVKGVITRPDALHICYCHSPPRYIWDMEQEYLRAVRSVARPLLRWLFHYLRLADFAAAQRVDAFVANSNHTAKRIRKFYRRESTVINPPVEASRFRVAPAQDYYLYIGNLEAYKRPDLVVEAFNRLGKKVLLAGSGPLLKKLRRVAKANVYLLGWVDDERAVQLYSECRALIFPGVEDFGIVPLEAMASGKPVIAYAAGGALETVVDEVTGLFFKEQTTDALCDAVERFEKKEADFDPDAIREHSLKWDLSLFKERFRSFVEREWTRWKKKEK